MSLVYAALMMLSSITVAKKESIQIEFKGNCGLHLSDGDSDIYIDFPYKSGAFGYMEFDSSELDQIKEDAIFIFTHKHADHYSKKNLKSVMKKKGGRAFGVSNISELEEVSSLVEEFEIRAFKTKHTFFGVPFRHYSYLITWHGKRIFLSGDTTNPETIGEVKDIDWGFVPYWILLNAKEGNIAIDAERLGVYHLYPQQIPSAKEAWDEVDHIRPMVEQGEKIEIEF